MPDYQIIDLHAIARTAITQYGFDFTVAKSVIDEINALDPGKLLDAAQDSVKDLRALLWSSIDNEESLDLVLGLGYNIPAICVDTHVHRITNRLGWVKTKNPEETEEALKKIIPKKEWISLNTALVAFGQNICLPVSPFCSRCNVFKLCKRVAVKSAR